MKEYDKQKDLINTSTNDILNDGFKEREIDVSYDNWHIKDGCRGKLAHFTKLCEYFGIDIFLEYIKEIVNKFIDNHTVEEIRTLLDVKDDLPEEIKVAIREGPAWIPEEEGGYKFPPGFFD